MKRLFILLCSFFITLPSLAESKVSPVLGLGIVVNDIEESVLQYNRLLGIEQWRYIDLNTKKGALRLAQGSFKGKQLELIQPLFGTSLAAKFLAKHGPGLFHLQLRNSEALAKLSLEEKATADKSHRLEEFEAYQASWFDTYKSLGIYIKQDKRPIEARDFWGQQQLPAQDLALGSARLAQLGVVVADAEASAKNWRRLLDVKPWVFVDFKPPMTSDGQYRGATGEGYSHVYVGYGQLADLQIELLEPVAGPTPHRDYLRAFGAGAHHISLGRLPEHDTLVASYKGLGLNIQMQSDNGGEGRTATYMGSEAELSWVLELTRAFRGLGSLTIKKRID